jgi:nucleoside 2-deoxyribosyltransferase
MSGRTITEHAADIISESDLLIAILDSKQSNSNIYFELGYAFGLGKRILVVVPPELALPTDLTDMFYIRASAG